MMSWFHRSRKGGGTSTLPSPSEPRFARGAALDARTRQIGRELLDAARSHRAGALSSQFWSDRWMRWAMKDPAFKVELFRFVDVFPMLRAPEQVYDYLVDYLSRPGVTLPPGMDLGLKAGGLAKGALAKAIAGRIASMAATFLADRDAVSALPTLRRRWDQGLAFSVDLLGEACVSDDEAADYRGRYLALIETLPDAVDRWPADERLERDHLGLVPRTNVSIKISSLDARADPIDFEGSVARLLEALRPILEAARQRNVLVNFDMEQHAFKDLTLELFERCCEEVAFPAGIALQSYLRSGDDDARRIVAWTKRTGRQVTVRLIKGAYWDYEVMHAERMGWPVPVWTRKRHTDACFERMADVLIGAAPRRPDQGGVKLALGSHNVRSIASSLARLEEHGLAPAAIELQMLFGMADPLKAAAVERRLRLREYVPLGEMIPGMAYLVRRLLENTSNQSWLRAGFAEDTPDDELLASPHDDDSARAPSALGHFLRGADDHGLSAAVEGLGDGKAMANEPVRDFAQKETRTRFGAAVRAAAVPEVAAPASAEQAREAVARALAAWPGWRDADPLERSRIILRAASRLRDRRDELAAIMIREAGKTWREADADVCEAIDFCEYYSRQAVGLFRPERLGRFVAENNAIWHEARGVAAVISPWNFPLAICAGMTTAALVTGNAAIVKPSGQTPGIARVLCDVLHEAGVPSDVVQLVHGPGRVVGAALVRSRDVALIAFTGSKEVGLDILRAAGNVADGQRFIKKVVCEMGGKNAIVVDESADLDEAVLGVRQSAFGYGGQKCSACSRAIVVESVYADFLKRLVAATRSLTIGDPADPSTDLGPVIDEAAAQKIRRYIEIGRHEGQLELACEAPPGLERRVGKPFVGPHVFSAIEPHHRLANDEIFGPVLSVMRAADFEQAIRWANATAYKLTGGVFSRKPSHLDLARRAFRVGNLYLNRGITGALVGRQPFGGFGLSGTGTKAGGAEYLLHFVEPRCATENTMRHGFAPGLEPDDSTPG